MSDVSRRVADLSPERLQRLIERLQGRAPADAGQRIVPRPARLAPLPASFAQERLWFLEQLEPGTALYNVTAGLRLSGRLRVPALAAALTGLVARHESLRTTFVEIEGRPYQAVAPAAGADLPRIDLSALPEATREDELARLAAEQARRPFDLARGPLLRASLVRLSGEDHAFVCILHHIVSDGWSAGVLVRELSALYEAFSAGLPSPLPPLPIQYPDYAVWQREHLQGETLAARLAYWRERLAGLPPLDLPTDRSRPVVATFRGGRLPVAVPRPATGRLQEIARRSGASLFMALLAVFEELLHRYARQEDFGVGTPVANRDRSELEGLIGFFVNSVVLRAEVSGDPTFSELLDRVRQTTLTAYAHQDLPFERLVEELRPERDLARSPLFQVMLSLHNAPAEPLRLPELTLAPLPLDGGTAKFELLLSLAETGEGLAGEIEYNAGLFDRATIERLRDHFAALLGSAAAEPHRRLSELPMLTEPERRELLAWNDTGEAEAGGCLHELFEAQAARIPEAVALIDGTRRWTYRELDLRASLLAHLLIRRGVGPEIPVAVCLERTADLPAALLAVLKAGGAYVPLDPAHPRERLAFLLADSRAAVLITRKDLAAGLAGVIPTLDLDAGEPDGPDRGKPASGVGPEHLSYILYTSGSTGRPKGVAVEHRSAAALIGWALRTFSAEELAGVLAATSAGFDLSVFELFAPWAAGGAAILAENALELPELPAAGEVTLVNTVPSAIAALARQGGIPPSVRTVNLAGEPLKSSLAREVCERSHAGRIWNLYGPTEDTTYSTAAPVDRSDAREPSIGRPLPGTRAHVLDPYGREVPVGVPGELCLSGAGLARGYLGRPGLTAERFGPDPFSSEPGARLYRTGDLVRRRPGGDLDFLGRIDHQVKIRGVRVELGEVESVLAAHPAVREAVALVRDDGGDRRLIAWVVATDGAAPESAALREHLRARLPEVMVPSAFVVLDRLPLTPNGKLDRKALPAPERAESAARETPRNEVEEILAGIWSEILRAGSVSIHDDFFALGGHSLLATQVVSRVRDAFAVELPLKAVFERPTVAGLAAAVEARRRGAAGEAPPLAAGPRPADLPLSFAQQRLWFLDRLEPGSLYNIPAALRLEGSLAVPALAHALAAVTGRHEALRTTFPERGGRPVQAIAPPPLASLPVVDLAALPASHRREALDRELAREAAHPFDLVAEPLLRTVLFRLDEREHVLALTVHHIVADAWSIGVFVHELGELYGAFAAGRPSPLPALEIQYADFALWQRGWLTGAALERLVAAWRERLSGAPSSLDLPTDRPRPPVQTFRGASLPGLFGAETAEELRGLARREGATLFMTLLAAFSELLHRHSGQEDLVVGTPIAGRGRREIEGLIGLFLNTLALRTDLSGDPSFRGLLTRVRGAALDAYALQDLPFEKLVEELQPSRDLSRSPVFQVMLSLQNTPPASLALPGLALEALRVDSGTAKFDLLLSLAEEDGGIRGSLEYNSGLFDAATVGALLSRFAILLAGIAADPDRRLSELPLLSAAELRQILHGWNDTAVEVPREPVHRLFEAQVERTPDAVAAVFQGESLTYAGLNARANRLAHRLRSLGVGPEALVGVSLERSLDLLVAVLGILKAGAAYLPLDPSYPAERLAFMLQDSGAALVLDAPEEAGPARDPGNPQGDAGPQSRAYVLYTSGSTGRPKGVQVPHSALTNFLAAMGREPGLRAGDVLLAVTSLSFDIAALELYLPLLAGARVEITSGEAAGDGRRLLALLRSSGATVVQATPATWGMLLEASWEETDRLRLAMTGGEALRTDLAARLLQRADEVWNVYGPTETTVWSTAHRVEADSAPTVPIGRPIANTRLYVLDRLLVPRPAGAPGELYIGGAGVARGYLGRPDLTAERFVPDPWSAAGGERLYRTGDLVRARPGGAFEFLGRVDHQVKVRGFRIETGEIEVALAAHPAVREAAVVVRADGGDPRLVAYVVRRDGASSSDAELFAGLRELLGRSLPAYMVPGVFMALDALPLTPNRKVDRKALPVPERTAAMAFVAPGNPVEEILAGIWADVLRLPRVGTKDNFFSLGGHSLLATQMISRVRTAFGVELPLRELFEAPTVAGLAERVERARGEAGSAAAPPLRRMAREGELPLSFAQQRLWFLDQLAPGNPFYNIPSNLRMSGPLDVRVLTASLDKVVRRHEGLRTTFVSSGGRPVQLIAPPGALTLPFVDLAGLPPSLREAEVWRLMREEASRPFNLARGPLFRVALVGLAPEEHAVLATLHHIISDGWSSGVLRREVGVLYGAFAEGRPSPLPELPIQYPDYALWQRQWLQGEVLAAHLGYWKERLADPPGLDLPADRPRPALGSFRGAWSRTELPLAGALSRLAHRRGATLYMALLALFKTLLYRYTGQSDLLVGTPIANRNRSEIEGLIGFFANTLALRTDLSGNPGFDELIHRVREVTLGAYTHQELPFEKLIEELHPERDTNHNPLFQVVLVLQNFPEASVRLPDLTFRAVEVGHGTTKFDLTLFLGEDDVGGLAALLEYSTDLFDRSTMGRLLAHFRVLAESVVDDPERPIGDLSLLPEAERHQLLVDWAGKAEPGRSELLLHRRFEARVRRDPAAPAVVFQGERLSYGELNGRANRLARRLRARGVGPEVPVALCLERTPAMVVAILAVLKAGGAYVPLDPAYPRERLGFLLEDSRAPVLLTEESLLDRLPPSGAQRLCLEEELPASESADDLDVAVAPQSLAYVIYTSGSTGRPKGVLVSHANVARLFDATAHWFGFDESDVWTLFHSYAFDFSVWEIWGALLHGGRLVVVPHWVSRSPEAFHELLRREGVTVLNQTPSAFRQLARAGEASGAETALRLVIFGGEALDVQGLAPWFARHPEDRPRLVNMYGITETTVHVTYRPVGAADLAAGGASPIGGAIPDLRVFVLDPRLQPVPVGVPGEIHVGGAGLARGYLGRSELTAERFVPHPFPEEPGERLYRSGDLARYRPDGGLEYLGRGDHQVKIRGFRIELGEIQAVLSGHPEVREAAVVFDPARQRLVAYVVPKPPDRPAEREADAVPGSEQVEQVEQWRMVFDGNYVQSPAKVDPAFDITGWNSAYTGQPIPAEEMREWVEGTVGRILAERPTRVLEIGCGTGLLLFRIAPHAVRYRGTDFSRTALDQLRRRLADRDLPHVELEQRAADDFSGIEPATF
ncbi:MAG TPA: amino acid adenylation domain-containing protein, partial [Thermoanaerobaculia bacterium]|nr:amino acid adenylation domain-containing protein [Thermoanaerobaculia bacterium]